MSSRALVLLISFVILIAAIIFVNQTVNWYSSLNNQYAEAVSKEPFGDWREFQSEASHFSVKLPAMAQNATEEVVDKKNKTKRFYDLYIAEKENGSLFMVTRTTFADPKVLNPASKIMQEMIREIALSKQDSKIRSLDEYDYKGNEGFKFVIDRTDGIYRGIMFHHGPSLYLLSYIDPKKSDDEEDYNYFLNSFLLSN